MAQAHTDKQAGPLQRGNMSTCVDLKLPVQVVLETVSDRRTSLGTRRAPLPRRGQANFKQVAWKLLAKYDSQRVAKARRDEHLSRPAFVINQASIVRPELCEGTQRNTQHSIAPTGRQEQEWGA